VKVNGVGVTGMISLNKNRALVETGSMDQKTARMAISVLLPDLKVPTPDNTHAVETPSISKNSDRKKGDLPRLQRPLPHSQALIPPSSSMGSATNSGC